jgi:hypothetical protein
MSGRRGPLLALWLALCFHGPLIAGGLYRYSYDAATHEFFADHYARAPFALWDPRWFTGFSVASYPPLVHQLVAIVASLMGYEGAFGAILLAALLAFPIAVWCFARLFVSPGAAGAAAIVAVFLPAATLTADAFGQLPTLVALVLSLLLVYAWARYVERGGRARLALVASLSGLAFTAHHATPLLFLPAALVASFAALLWQGDRGPRIRRAAVATAACATVGALAIAPFWIWSRDAPHQAFIPHLSRADFLSDLDAQSLFFWAMYGVLPALALFGLRAGGRRAAPCAVLALGYAVIGLGGTTPLPSVLFGAQWQWLTYDRFALWAAVALLPIAGVGVERLVAARTAFASGAVALALVALAGYSIVDSSLTLLGTLPHQRDVRSIAEFLNAGDRARWRFQTFGLGETSVRLGYLTNAMTIDGAYFSARQVPELAQSGIGMLDYALWWDPSGTTLRRALAAADQYSIRWAFVADVQYEDYLVEAGFRRVATLDGRIAVWEKPGVSPLAAAALRFGDPDLLGILWGTLPLTLFAATVALGFAQHSGVAYARVGRSIARWKPSRRALERPLSP